MRTPHQPRRQPVRIHKRRRPAGRGGRGHLLGGGGIPLQDLGVALRPLGIGAVLLGRKRRDPRVCPEHHHAARNFAAAAAPSAGAGGGSTAAATRRVHSRTGPSSSPAMTISCTPAPITSRSAAPPRACFAIVALILSRSEKRGAGMKTRRARRRTRRECTSESPAGPLRAGRAPPGPA